MKQKYRHTFRCSCGKTFKKISTNPDLSEAACPECKKKETWRRNAIGDGPVSESDIVETRPFIRSDKYLCNSCTKHLSFRVEQEGDKLSHCYRCGSQDVSYVGQVMYSVPSSSKATIKALDIVGEDAMKSYGMTDLNLNSTMKPGDDCAPKLPPRQQQMVDGFFNHGKNPSLRGVNLNSIGRNAIAGAYRDPNNPVAAAHKAKLRPSIEGKYIDASPGRK